MEKPKHHLFVCASFRAGGDAKGACSKKNATSLLQYLENEISDRDMNDCMVSSTGCMNRCEKGPIMVIYPEGYWYGEVNEDKIDTILDALQEGQPVDELLLN